MLPSPHLSAIMDGWMMDETRPSLNSIYSIIVNLSLLYLFPFSHCRPRSKRKICHFLVFMMPVSHTYLLTYQPRYKRREKRKNSHGYHPSQRCKARTHVASCKISFLCFVTRPAGGFVCSCALSFPQSLNLSFPLHNRFFFFIPVKPC